MGKKQQFVFCFIILREVLEILRLKTLRSVARFGFSKSGGNKSKIISAQGAIIFGLLLMCKIKQISAQGVIILFLLRSA